MNKCVKKARVMDTGDHFKNGASPKSLMSRGNSKFKKSVVIFSFLMSLGVIAQAQSSIPVKIAYMEDGKIIPNTVVYLLYQEQGKPELVEKTTNTGGGKEVSFNVPLDKDGASCPFVVLYTKEEVNKAKELAKTSSIRAFRTPPGENCEFIKLSVTKGGGMRTDGCSIQMWSMGKK